MFEDIVSTLLSTYLGDYLEGLSRKDLKLSLWKGDVELKNLRVRTEALDFLNLPIQVKEGFVGTLTLKIPWKYLSKKPTIIQIDDVFVIACPKSELKYNEEQETERAQNRKHEQLSAIEDNEIRMNEELSAKNNNSSMARLIAKIIDKLQVRINRVHIRFEDHSSCAGHSFAAGIILEKLYLYSPTEKGDEDLLPGVMQKKMELARFGVYWDFDESACVHTKNVESMMEDMSYAFAEPESVPLEKRGLYPRHWIVDPISLSLQLNADIRKVELRKPDVDSAVAEVLETLQWSDKVSETKRLVQAYKSIRKDQVRGRKADQEWALMRDYLETTYPGAYFEESLQVAQDFCYRCWDVSNRPTPILEVRGDVNQVMIHLDQKQYRDMLGFLSSLNTQTLRARYKQFKPHKADPETNPKRWWRFAIKAVMWENAKKRSNKGWNDYLRFKKMRAEYIDLFKRKSQEKDLLKTDPKAVARLEKLENKLSLENILLFRKIALQECEQEEKIIEKRREKKKKEKNVLRNLFRKKQKETEEDGISEEDLRWDESKRNELFAEFDINPEETSPWEGGRPTDIQLTAQLHIPKVGVVLTNNESPILVCSLEQLGLQVVKMKKYLQVYSCVEDLKVKDGSQKCEKWPNVVYTEQNALVDSNSVTRFLPEGIYMQEETLPFLQMSLEIPALQKDVDLSVKLQTLPVCVVVNTACVMDIAAFFIPELAKLNFAALQASASSLYSQLSSSKKLRLKASKEVLSHKNFGLDVFIGAFHMIIPEDINQDVSHTQSLVVRSGDVRIISNPRRVSVDEVLTESNIYDNIEIDVTRVSVLMTDRHAHWAQADVQEKYDLCLVDNFDLHCTVGLSISPSTPEFATTCLNMNMNMIHICLTKTRCISLVRYLSAVFANMSLIVTESDVDFSALTEEAKLLVNNTLAAANHKEVESGDTVKETNEKADTLYSEEEQRLLQQNRIFSANASFEGVCVLIEEVSSANEHTKIINSSIAGLNVSVEQRTYDLSVGVSLQKIEVLDCLQTASRRTNKYLVLSQPVNEKGEICQDEESKLVKVTVNVVREASPDYSPTEGDVQVEIAFGVLSVMVYRPTIYHLLRFVAPILQGEITKSELREEPSRRRRSSSSVSSVISSIMESDGISVTSRAAELITNKSRNYAKVEQMKPIPKEWEKKQVRVILKLGSVNALLVTDRGNSLFYASILGVDLSLDLTPAFISVSGNLQDVVVLDTSEGHGFHPSILSIIHTEEQSSFISLSCILYSDVRYPKYPGYPAFIGCTMCAPSVCVRMRYVDELKHYFLAGPISEGIKLFEKSEKTPTAQSATRLQLETIMEEDDNDSTVSNDVPTTTLGKSLRESIILLGKNYLILDKEKLQDVPFELPLIQVMINNFQVSVPVASDSQEMVTFEMGCFAMHNSKPRLLPDSNQLDRSSLKSTLNTLQISITRMRASTSLVTDSGISKLALLGGIDLTVVTSIANQIDVNAHITKMALTANEKQLAFAMRVIKENFAERAVVMEDEIMPEEKKEQTTVSATPVPTKTPRKSGRLSGLPDFLAVEEDGKDDEVVFGKFIQAQFSFDGICVELLSGNKGYDAQEVGQNIYAQMGSLENSISSIDVGVLQASINLRRTEFTAGLSLSHVVFTDTRSTTSIDPAYRVPLSFGAQSMPAISALVSGTARDIREFKELAPLYGAGVNTVQDIQASVSIGSMRVIATPWIFDIVNILQNLAKEIQVEDLKLKKKQEKETEDQEVSSEKEKPPFYPHITLDLHVENPVFYIIENPSDKNSSSFIVSLALYTSLALSPMRNIDGAIRVSGIRCCRSHPSETYLPPPGLMDALSPFDININVHSLDNFTDLKGTLMTNHDVDIRVGIIDVKLLMNAFDNLVPREVKERLKTRKETQQKETTEEGIEEEKEATQLLMNFKIMLNSFAITVVNDSKDYEIPVMMMKIGDVGGDVVMTENDAKVNFGLWMVAEYYNAQLTVWEPVLEKWDVNLTVNQEKRDRIIQRRTALSGKDGSNIMAKVVLNTPHLLNLNLSSSFIEAALSSINALKECVDTTQKIGDSFFIGVRNSTGTGVTYSVINDNGVNALMRKKVEDDNSLEVDHGLFAGLVNLVIQGRMNTYWCAMHYSTPHLRIYEAIPTSIDIKPVLCTDSVSMDINSDDDIYCKVCSFDDVRMYVGTEELRREWQEAITTSLKFSQAPPQPRVKSIYLDATAMFSLDSHSSVLVTTLPAHPSLTLRYNQLPYRKLQQRTIQIQMEGFDPFVCEVDRASSRFIELQNEEEIRDVFIETTIENGRKILNLCSSISIQNLSGNDLCCGFGDFVPESGIAYAYVNPLSLKRNERQWMDTKEASGLFIGRNGEMTQCLDLEGLLHRNSPDIVNIGSDDDPLFTVITCKTKIVSNADNVADTRETYIITIADMTKMENLLPVPIEYAIITKEDEIQKGELGVGEVGSLTCVCLDENCDYRIALRLKNDSMAFSPFDTSISLSREKGIVHMENKFEYKYLNLSYVVSCDEYHSLFIQVYADYWAINKTGDPIILQDSKQDKYTYPLPSHPLTLKNKSETTCAKEEMIMPTLISLKKKDKNDAVRLTLKGYENYSDSFSINTTGVSGTVTLDSKDKKKPQKNYAVTISRAPGIFARSLVVTLTPLYIIINQSGTSVSLRQSDTDNILHLNEGTYTPFHWPSPVSHMVQIRVDNYGYEWSQPFELVPSHMSLQMTKCRSQKSKYDVWEKENLEDPTTAQYSVVQVDITMMKSQCYVFIKKMDPNYMPFCISNNTALDSVTVSQEQASLGTALTLPPLSSQLWTLPLVNGPQKIHISVQRIGSKLSKSCFTTALSVNVTKPGKLGTIHLRDPQRTLSVSLDIQKSMRVITIEEVNKKRLFSKAQEKDTIQYLLQRRRDLMNISSEVDDDIDTQVKTIQNYILEQERSGSGLPSSACSTYLQLVCSYSDAFSGKPLWGHMRMTVNREKVETSTSRGVVNYYDLCKVINEVDELPLTLELRPDLGRTLTGTAILPLHQFKEKDQMYDVIVPFYSKESELVGYAEVRFVNSIADEIAEVAFRKEELYLQKSLVESTLQKLLMEAYIERTLSKKSRTTSQDILRATHSGVYRTRSSSSTSSSPPTSLSHLESNRSFNISYSSYGSTLSIDQLQALDSDEIADDMEAKMNYCVIVDQLRQIPMMPETLDGLYVKLKIGKSELRTALCSDVGTEERKGQSEYSMFVESLNFGCEFCKNGNSTIVSRVDRDSEAEQEGVEVGDILTAINDGDVPPTLDGLDMLLKSSDENVLDFLAPHIETNSYASFGQQLIFPVGATVGEAFMTVSVYKESDNSEEDTLMVSCELPIIREGDVGCNVRLGPGFTLSMSSSWSSFDPEEELIKLDLSVNIRGIGVSIINGEPEELIYVSVNGIKLNLSQYENGKLTAEAMVNTLQVDNQILGARFPVLFGSPIDASTMNWLHAAVVILPHPSVLFIEYCSILIQEMKASSDSNILNHLLTYISDLPLNLLQLTSKDPLRKLNDYPEFISPLLIPDSTLNSTTLFAEQLELQPLLITLTNKIDPAYPLKSSILPSIPILIPLQAVIDTFGTLLGNVDNAQIRMSSFATENLFISQHDLINRLQMHYVKQLMGQLYKIIGSFNLLGNPVGLAENITSGVKAFFYEPMQGLVRSPKDFAVGLGRGTKKLLMNTTFGVMNTVSKITGTVADGLSSLTMSEEYKNDRAAGKGGILYGVKEGVTGVFKDTYNGAKKKGLLGAATGIGKGLIGFVVKPVVGVVDQTTKVIDSVKGVTQVEKVLTRLRNPRYIYKDHCISPFNKYLAEGQMWLSMCKRDSNVPTNEEYMVHVIDDSKTALLIGNSRFIWMDSVSRKIMKIVKFKHIIGLSNSQRKVIINCDNGTRSMIILDERLAAIIPSLYHAIIERRNERITNLIVRMLVIKKEDIVEEDKLLAMQEKLDDDMETDSLIPKIEPVTPMDLAPSTVSSATVKSYHQGLEAKKALFTHGSTYTEYEIEVISENEGVKWIVYRRYRQFEELNDELKKMFPEKASRLRLPGKQMKLFQNGNILNKRMEELNYYLQLVIADSEMCDAPATSAFLKDNFIDIIPL